MLGRNYESQVCSVAATLEVVESPYGHDAFLKETDRIAPLLRDALAGC